MIDQITNTILSFVPIFAGNIIHFYGFLFTIAFAESTPIIGTFAPGSVVLMIFGFLAYEGYGRLPMIITVACIGATLGETIGYYLGRYGRAYLQDHKGAFRYSHLELAKIFFTKHGGKSVCFGRFIGPLRPVISIFAGMSEMPFYKFMGWNLLGSFLWSGVYIMLGFLFGSNWEVVQTWGARVGLILTVGIISAVYLYILRKKIKAKERNIQ